MVARLPWVIPDTEDYRRSLQARAVSLSMGKTATRQLHVEWETMTSRNESWTWVLRRECSARWKAGKGRQGERWRGNGALQDTQGLEREQQRTSQVRENIKTGDIKVLCLGGHQGLGVVMCWGFTFLHGMFPSGQAQGPGPLVPYRTLAS